MLVIVGCIVVTAAVLIGFIGSGGHVGALIHPYELVTIGGSALGAMLVMSPKKVMVDLVKGLIQALKGTPYNKQMYKELFELLYGLFRVARRQGFLALEIHLGNPHESDIFNKSPKVAADHHAVEFICGALTPILEGTAKPDQLPALLAAELRVVEEEHHAPMNVLVKTADALPGFGIVAAVLGIVITMGAIDGPVEEIGHKVGAALVGTFLGILLSYGFLGPLAGRMEFLGAAEMAYFHTIESAIIGFVNDLPPKVAVEQARRGVGTEWRPTREELDQMFKDIEAAAA